MLESVDLGTLAEGGGAGTIIGIGLWKLASVLRDFVNEVREFVKEYKEERVETKSARSAALKHYETEEAIFEALKADRQSATEGEVRLKLLEEQLDDIRERVLPREARG